MTTFLSRNLTNHHYKLIILISYIPFNYFKFFSNLHKCIQYFLVILPTKFYTKSVLENHNWNPITINSHILVRWITFVYVRKIKWKGMAQTIEFHRLFCKIAANLVCCLSEASCTRKVCEQAFCKKSVMEFVFEPCPFI